MDLGIKDRAVLVTGASRGLGKAVAERLAREGADIVVNARSPGVLDATARDIAHATGRTVVPVAGDVADEGFCNDLVGRVAGEFGRLDILVTNAGGPPPGGFGDFTRRTTGARSIRISCPPCSSPLAALPEMRRNGWVASWPSPPWPSSSR